MRIARRSGVGRVALAAGLAVATASLAGWRAGAASAPRPEIAAQRLVARTLAALPVYPGSLSVPAAGFPVAVRMVPLTADLVDAHRQYSAPVAPARLGAWLEAVFPGRGLHPSGSYSSSGPAGPGPQGRMFEPRRRVDRLTVVVAYAAGRAGRTDVRYDVRAVWVPRRPPDTRVPARPARVVVALVASGTGVRAVALTGRRPALLVRRTDGLAMAVPGVSNCPILLADDPSVRVRFAWRGGALTFAEIEGGCGGVVVTGRRGGTLAGLADPGYGWMGAVERVLAGTRSGTAR